MPACLSFGENKDCWLFGAAGRINEDSEKQGLHVHRGQASVTCPSVFSPASNTLTEHYRKRLAVQTGVEYIPRIFALLGD